MSSSNSSYNTRSPAVKRLLKEAQELNQPTELYFAQPLEDNIFEWHFTIRGPSDTDFDGGVYHGRILLPAEYPMKPPSIILLTPNGRFKVNEKICLSISGHHPETWLPSWSIRTALLALIGFMPTMGEGAIGSLDYTSDERKLLAKKSLGYSCTACKTENSKVLLNVTEKSKEESAEAVHLASQIEFKNTKPAASTSQSESNNQSPADTSEPASQLTHRHVNSDQAGSSATSPPPASQPNVQRILSQPQMTTQSSSQGNATFYSVLMFVLGFLFLFLLIRRIYLVVDGTNNRSFPNI